MLVIYRQTHFLFTFFVVLSLCITFFFAVNIPPPEIQESDAANSARSDLREPKIPLVHEVTEEAAKAALLSHVKKKCCYGAAAAKNMNVVKIMPTSAFHVSILTNCIKMFKSTISQQYISRFMSLLLLIFTRCLSRL
jgi:hypothetical protein